MSKRKPPSSIGHKLDYRRTNTDAKIRIEFVNGDTFDIPAHVVAENRDAHYADEEEDTIGFIKAGLLGKGELLDWLANNMNWSDVAPFAVKVERDDPYLDYEAEWGDANKEIVGDV